MNKMRPARPARRPPPRGRGGGPRGTPHTRARAGLHVRTVAHAGHASLACLDGTGFDVLIVENELVESHGSMIVARLRRYCPNLQLVRLCHGGSGMPGSGMPGEGIAVARPMTA